MKKKEQGSFGTYRCPVCGHGDTVELAGQQRGRRIECSYCGAALELGERDAGSGRLNVRLVDEEESGAGDKKRT